jgi:hypothetical protein
VQRVAHVEQDREALHGGGACGDSKGIDELAGRHRWPSCSGSLGRVEGEVEGGDAPPEAAPALREQCALRRAGAGGRRRGDR